MLGPNDQHCLVLKNQAGKVRPCKRDWECQTCPVPTLFGFRWNEAKAKWERTYHLPGISETIEIFGREALEAELQ